MGQRCGCVGRDCTCAIRAGRGVTLTGEGSQAVPLEVTQFAPAYLRAASTDETSVTLTGDGSPATPYILGMTFTGVADSKPLSITDYTTPGTSTWTRPNGCTLVEVTVIGGGAGGSAGFNPAPTVGFGNYGGQGGGWTKKVVALPVGVTECTVTVGSGGAGGSGSAGTPGGFGGDSWFRIGTDRMVYAKGGAPGSVTGYGTGVHTGYQSPESVTDSRYVVENPSGGGGGKAANGDQDADGAILGGSHLWYTGTTGGDSLGYGGDGGRGGRAFVGTVLTSGGHGVAGYAPGGGGGGGRGGASGLVYGGGTWTFSYGNGGAGGRGFVRVVAY